MAKRITPQLMTSRDWLVLSDKKLIQNRMSNDPYSMAYPALLSHFSATPISWDATVLGLHVVYGWMPTIPKLGSIMRWDQSKRKDLAGVLIDVKNGLIPDDDKLELLKSFCNNSMIGASKFMHFLKPDTFPIWDSRVAKVFWNNPKASPQKINSIASWKTYRSSLNEWLSDPVVVSRCSELRSLACFLAEVSNLRLVELVLFHKTESKRKSGTK